MKEYNDRVAAIESRSKGQRGDIEANVKKLEKDIEEIMASIDAYNKESDNKVSSLNSKKDELAEAGKKKVIEYQNEIQALRNQNTDYKDKIVKTDVGTFKFIAKSLGVPLDTAVNYFIWSIMLVFDPLAVCLILAYNTLVGKKKENNEENKPISSTPVLKITPTPTPVPTVFITQTLSPVELEKTQPIEQVPEINPAKELNHKEEYKNNPPPPPPIPHGITSGKVSPR
jgi:hypothetical protein